MMTSTKVVALIITVVLSLGLSSCSHFSLVNNSASLLTDDYKGDPLPPTEPDAIEVHLGTPTFDQEYVVLGYVFTFVKTNSDKGFHASIRKELTKAAAAIGAHAIIEYRVVPTSVHHEFMSEPIGNYHCEAIAIHFPDRAK